MRGTPARLEIQMPSLAGILGAGAVAKGIGESLGLARAANPRSTALASSRFQGELGHAAQNLAASSQAPTEPGVSHGALPTAGIGGATSLEEIRSSYKIVSTEFEQRLRNLLRERGVDIGEEVVLEADALGQINVVGYHPQKQAIENLFRELPDLRNQFVKLESQAELLRAADIAGEIQQLNISAPLDAAEMIQQLLGAKAGGFSLAVRPHEITARFV